MKRQIASPQVIELVLIGIAVGLAVFGVRAWMNDAPLMRWGVLLSVAVVIILVDLLILRRLLYHQSPLPHINEHPRPRDLFAREANPEWTGLSEQIPDELSTDDGSSEPLHNDFDLVASSHETRKP